MKERLQHAKLAVGGLAVGVNEARKDFNKRVLEVALNAAYPKSLMKRLNNSSEYIIPGSIALLLGTPSYLVLVAAWVRALIGH